MQILVSGKEKEGSHGRRKEGRKKTVRVEERRKG